MNKSASIMGVYATGIKPSTTKRALELFLVSAGAIAAACVYRSTVLPLWLRAAIAAYILIELLFYFYGKTR